MNTISNSSALITDIDRRKSIPIIRSLGREGVRVVGISYKRFPVGSTSKFCSKYYRCPDYRKDPVEFLEWLEEICKIEKFDVFYPLEDVILSLCVQNPGYWNRYVNAVLPSAESLDNCYDKWKTIQIAHQCGISTPLTYCPNDIDEAASIASCWQGKAVIKPRKSSGSRGIVYVDNPADIVDTYQKVASFYPRPLIQEKIPNSGMGLGVFALFNKKCKLTAIFGHKRLREFPVSGGPSTLRTSYRDEQLFDQTIRLFKEIGFSGVAMAEYKLDERNNQPKLLEINPRFWGSIQLAISSGVNFPVLYHKTALGYEVVPKLDFKLGEVCRWLMPGDILHFISNPNRFDLKPSFFKFFGKNLHYDIISKKDPLPILGIIFESFRKVIKY